jgi:single-strand DNA-binding protein
VNLVILFGNLGADPELRYAKDGQPILSLRLATRDGYLDKANVWQEQTEWHNVVVFGKRAEPLAKLLRKGSTILVHGKLKTRSWDDKDGKKHYATEVRADNIELGEKRGEGAPNQAPKPARREYGAKPAYQDRNGDFHEPSEPDGDIPF